MRKGQASLPLAFILAMAADASAAATPGASQAAPPLEAGERILLEKGLANEIARDPHQSGDRRLAGDKAAQYFPNFPNFRSCISGYWRNC